MTFRDRVGLRHFQQAWDGRTFHSNGIFDQDKGFPQRMLSDTLPQQLQWMSASPLSFKCMQKKKKSNRICLRCRQHNGFFFFFFFLLFRIRLIQTALSIQLERFDIVRNIPASEFASYVSGALRKLQCFVQSEGIAKVMIELTLLRACNLFFQCCAMYNSGIPFFGATFHFSFKTLSFYSVTVAAS